jgi:hypothetical protein
LVADVMNSDDDRRIRSFLYTYKLHATPATLLEVVQAIADNSQETAISRQTYVSIAHAPLGDKARDTNSIEHQLHHIQSFRRSIPISRAIHSLSDVV